jgi:hypothetical protein
MRKTLCLLLLSMNFCVAQKLSAAWLHETDSIKTMILATDKYVTVSIFNSSDGDFLESFGGKYELSNTDEINIELEFHSKKPQLVNSMMIENLEIKKKSLVWAGKTFEKIDRNKSNALSGLWRIQSILREDKMNDMPAGNRKTLKIMTGGYFQWFAINTGTAEFFGTGAGTYDLNEEVYTEKIMFFSRDKSRVGSSLSFKAKVNENTWEHSGKSSKGQPLKEMWKKAMIN